MADAKLGGAIKEKLGIPCVFDESALQLTRGLRNQIESLVEAASASEMKSMAIGLAHSLSRYKLKFSPDKVDTMIVQVPHPPPSAPSPPPSSPSSPSHHDHQDHPIPTTYHTITTLAAAAPPCPAPPHTVCNECKPHPDFPPITPEENLSG